MLLYFEFFGFTFQFYLYDYLINVDARMYFCLSIGWRQYLYGVKWFKTSFDRLNGGQSTVQWLLGSKN